MRVNCIGHMSGPGGQMIRRNLNANYRAQRMGAEIDKKRRV